MYICKCCGHDAFVWLGLLCSPHHHLLSECCGHDSILKVVRRATLPNRMIMDPSTRPQIDTGNSSWCSMRGTQFGVIAVGKTWTTFHDTVDPERLLRQQCPQKWKLHKVWSRQLTKTPRKSQTKTGLQQCWQKWKQFRSTVLTPTRYLWIMVGRGEGGGNRQWDSMMLQTSFQWQATDTWREQEEGKRT